MLKFISYSSIQIYPCSPVRMATYRLGIQLFKERLSEKVHATIQKGLVGGFEFTVLQRNLQEWHERP